MYKRRVAVRAIIYKDGKVLAVRHKDISSGSVSTYWATPGGGLDDGEDIKSGLRREMIEETGIEPVIGKLLLVQQFNDGEKEQLEFFFHVENVEAYEVLDLENTSHGMIEIEECDFINPREEPLLPAVLQTMNIATAIASNEGTHILNELSSEAL